MLSIVALICLLIALLVASTDAAKTPTTMTIGLRSSSQRARIGLARAPCPGCDLYVIKNGNKVLARLAARLAAVVQRARTGQGERRKRPFFFLRRAARTVVCCACVAGGLQPVRHWSAPRARRVEEDSSWSVAGCVRWPRTLCAGGIGCAGLRLDVRLVSSGRYL